MPDAEAATRPAPEERPHRRPLHTFAKWTAILLGALLILAAGLVAFINSDPGRRLVANYINDMEMASGLRIHVDRLEGSLYGKLTVHGLRLSDPKGAFLDAPVVQLDWRPLAYLRNHVDIRSADIPTARLRRLPALTPSGDPDAPLLPDLDIDIGRLTI